MPEPRLDKTQFKVFSSFEEADRDEREYWWSRSPLERIRQVELLRRLNYGDGAFQRLQRVFEVAERE